MYNVSPWHKKMWRATGLCCKMSTKKLLDHVDSCYMLLGLQSVDSPTNKNLHIFCFSEASETRCSRVERHLEVGHGNSQISYAKFLEPLIFTVGHLKGDRLSGWGDQTLENPHFFPIMKWLHIILPTNCLHRSLCTYDIFLAHFHTCTNGSLANFAKNSSKPRGGGVRCSVDQRSCWWGADGERPDCWKTSLSREFSLTFPKWKHWQNRENEQTLEVGMLSQAASCNTLIHTTNIATKVIEWSDHDILAYVSANTVSANSSQLRCRECHGFLA